MSDNIIDKFLANQYGVHSTNPDYMGECRIVREYYEFYEGKPDYEVGIGMPAYGQIWATPKNSDLNYTPTKEVRNITKKLLDKQARFMFSARPNLLLKPLDKEFTAEAEQKRMIIDTILEDTNFYSQTFDGFLDATIGKRVLLTIIANPNEPIRFRYYTMPEFTYETDPNDISKLNKVSIIYQDERTRGRQSNTQLWHKYLYEIREDGYCWLTYQMTTGDNTQITTTVTYTDETTGEETEIEVDVLEETNTLLDTLPCYVIINDGLTGDIYGHSDVKDLVDLAMNYNKTNSDFRDSLRFKMFEQPVIIDGDDDSVAAIKIAPNALINIKTDPTQTMDGTGKSATVTTLSGSFNFVAGADLYLASLKKDMYELMDQPLPEKLQEVPSAKALKFLFYDLIARCEQKWNKWSPAITWAITMIEKCVLQFNLYKDVENIDLIETKTMINLKHNYPIPEDDEIRRTTAMQEVTTQVRSHKSYIRDFGTVEDEEGEWEEIMSEADELNNSTNTGFMSTIDKTLNDPIANNNGDNASNRAKENAAALRDTKNNLE